jgi:Ring finger domain
MAEEIRQQWMPEDIGDNDEDDALIPCDGCDTMIRFSDYARHISACPAVSGGRPALRPGVFFVTTNSTNPTNSDAGPAASRPTHVEYNNMNTPTTTNVIDNNNIDAYDPPMTPPPSFRRRRLESSPLLPISVNPNPANHSFMPIFSLSPLWNAPTSATATATATATEEPDVSDQMVHSILRYVFDGDESVLDDAFLRPTTSPATDEEEEVEVEVEVDPTMTTRLTIPFQVPISSSQSPVSVPVPVPPARRQSTRLQPIAELLLTMPLLPIGNDYQLNSLLGEMIGNVEIGVSDINQVSTRVSAADLSSQTCPICQDSIGQDPATSPETYCRKTICGHVFCDTCITKWFESSKKCPVCMCDVEDKATS